MDGQKLSVCCVLNALEADGATEELLAFQMVVCLGDACGAFYVSPIVRVQEHALVVREEDAIVPRHEHNQDVRRK